MQQWDSTGLIRQSSTKAAAANWYSKACCPAAALTRVKHHGPQPIRLRQLVRAGQAGQTASNYGSDWVFREGGGE